VQSLTDIKRMLAERGLAPKKSLGQNFLIDHNLIRKLVDTVGVSPGDLVLEVGPGTGTLTEELLARGCRVVACELDDGLASMLRERSAAGELPGGGGEGGGGRLRVVHDDCISGPGKTLSPAAADALREWGASNGAGASQDDFALISNLPYGAGTPLVLTLLLHWPACRRMGVTIQKEVADRLAAPPGSRDYGLISVVAQSLADVKKIASLPPECFWPRPDVTSAMVTLTRRARPRSSEPVALADFCKLLFASRRKQLGSILGRSLAFPEGIDPAQRPEELSVEQIERLRLAVPAGGRRTSG
jgi:16S rRNA (adenine1518-N6/adenine1519-N6)-dimethyltransferase